MKIKTSLVILSSSLLIFFISACYSSTSPDQVLEMENPTNAPVVHLDGEQPTVEPYLIPTSLPNKATLRGNLFVTNPLMNAPDTDDAIFLVPLVDQSENIASIPLFVSGEVPQAVVDETNGDFIFVNIEPGYYAIVVLTINGQQVPARMMDQGTLAIINIDENDLGEILELDQLSLP